MLFYLFVFGGVTYSHFNGLRAKIRLMIKPSHFCILNTKYVNPNDVTGSIGTEPMKTAGPCKVPA